MNIEIPLSFNKPRFLIGILLLASLFNLIYFYNFFIIYNYLPNPFIFDKYNTFMDFYNPLFWSIDQVQYTQFKSVYPPLNYLFYNFTCLVFNCQNATNSFLFRDLNSNVNYLIIFCFYLSLFISFACINWKLLKLNIPDRFLLCLAISISPPVLFALERGNTIFLALPLISLFLRANKKIFKYILFGLFVNVKPYLLLLSLSEFNTYIFTRKNIIYLFISGLLIFLITSLFFQMDYVNFFSNYFIFAQKFPTPAAEILSLPFSLGALSALRNLNSNFHHYSAILFLPLVINTITLFILIALMLRKRLSGNELILSAFLVTTNFSSIIGGYAYLFYIPFLPLFYQEELSKKYLIILSLIFFLSFDFFPVINLNELYIHSYFGNKTIGQVNQYIGLGTFIRPILNYTLLAMFTFSKCRKYAFNINPLKNLISNNLYIRLNNPSCANKFGLALSLICIFIYNYLFSFSYLPITEGWFLAYAKLILNGEMPYKDFLIHLTPLYPLTIALFISIFGDSLFALRILGVFVILGIGAIVYLLLNKKFSPQSSFIATVTSLIYYQSGVAHITYDFTQFLTLAIAISILFLTNAFESLSTPPDQKNSYRIFINLFFSCFFASISFFIKQSNGTFVVIFTALSILFVLVHSKNLSLKYLLISFSGFITPVFVILGWLAWNESIGVFWSQIFTGAISAKGSISPIAFAWFSRLFSENLITQLCRLIAVFVFAIILNRILVYKKIFRIHPKNTVDSKFNLAILFSYFLILTTCIVISFTMPSGKFILKFSRLGSTVNSYILSACVLFIFIFYLFKKFRFLNSISADPTLTIIVTMSLGMIWGNGTSAGVGEIAVFLLFSILVASLLDAGSLFTLRKIIGIVISSSLITFLCITKFNTPYYWWGLKQQNVHEANYLVDANIGYKFHISNESADILQALDKTISKNSTGDIFAFPNIPIVYLISNRWPRSKILVQWFDFLPDNAAIEEADRILQNPPETIVNLNLPTYVWDAHELLFRGGRPSGQRSIQKSITTLTSEMDLYELTFSTKIPDGYKIDVWNLKNTR